MTDMTTKNSTTSQIETEAQNLVKVNKQLSQEQIMLDRALHLFGICYKGDRANDVMHNCVRIAMHEQGDPFNLEVIRGCNAMDITITEYVHSQADYLLNKYYK